MSRFACVSRLVFVAAVVGSGVGIAPTASAAPSKLMTMLPDGYSSSNCEVKPVKPPAIEQVGCGQNSAPDGPFQAAFALYRDADDMNTAFQNIKMDVASACPGNQKSPGPWAYDSSGKVGGQRKCGSTTSGSTTYAAVAWSDNAKLRTAVVLDSGSINDLYKWWKAKSG